MKRTSLNVPVYSTTSDEASGYFGALKAWWLDFWFRPVEPTGFHVIRLFAGLLFLSWLLPFAGQVDAFFGSQGWFDVKAYADLAPMSAELPPPSSGWSALYLPSWSGKIWQDPVMLKVVYWISIGVLVAFTLGLWTRLTSVLTWLVVASFTANPALEYDADSLLAVLAFYLMIGYILFGQRIPGQSAGSRLLGNSTTWFFGRPEHQGEALTPSLGANLALRLLQVHIAIAIFTIGIHKLQYGDWWAGVALWYPFFPPFKTALADVRSLAPNRDSIMFFLSLAAYATLAWQIGFPLFAWRARWRWLVVGGALVAWLGNALLYHMPLLGPALLLGCLSFLMPADWQGLFSLLSKIPGLQRLRQFGQRPSESPTPSFSEAAEKEPFIEVGQPG